MCVSPCSSSLSLRHEGSCARGPWRPRRARRAAAGGWPGAGRSPPRPRASEPSTSTASMAQTVRRRSAEACEATTGMPSLMAMDESTVRWQGMGGVRSRSPFKPMGAGVEISSMVSSYNSSLAGIDSDTILCWCLSSKCCPRTCFDDGFFVLAFRAHLVAVLTRAGRSRGRRRLTRDAAVCLCTVRVPWLLMAALRAGAVATSVGTWGPMARDSHRGSCLGRACAWYRDLRSYKACCLCVNANLRHEGSRHSDKEIL